MQTLMKVSCDPECGFMMQDHDEKELKKIVKDHAQRSNSMKMSDKDVEDKMEKV